MDILVPFPSNVISTYYYVDEVHVIPSATITGDSILFINSTTTYSTQAGMSDYVWSITGGTINSGAGTNSVSVTWDTIGAQLISVSYNNGGCTVSTTDSVTIYLSSPCLPQTCNLIINGDFECYNKTTDPNNDAVPFLEGLVPGWKGWNDCCIMGTNISGEDDYFPVYDTNYHQYAFLENYWVAPYYNGDGIYQDLFSNGNFESGYEYELKFDYSKPINPNAGCTSIPSYYIMINLSYFTPMGQSIPTFYPTTLPFNDSIILSNDTLWHHSPSFVFTFPDTNQLPQTRYLTIYPKCVPNLLNPNNNENYVCVKIDNVVVKPKIHFNLPNPYNLCSKQSATIIATVPKVYNFTNWKWYVNGTIIDSNTSTITVSPSVTTTYNIVATDTNGCQYTGTFTVNILPLPPLPIITGNSNNCDTIDIYSVTNSDSTYYYTWSVTNGTLISDPSSYKVAVKWNDTINYSTQGIIKVIVIDTNGCSDTVSFTVFPCCNDNKNYVNFHDTIIYPSEIVPGNKYYINGVVTIDSNVILLNNEFYMGSNAKINVSPGAQLYILQNSILTAGCEYMWDGVYVNDTSAKLYVTNGSTIGDAVNGLVSDSGGVLNLEDANMTNNYNNVQISNYTSTAPYPGYIRDCRFTGTASLPYLLLPDIKLFRVLTATVYLI